MVALQVKTTTTRTRFTLGEKNEATSEATNEWYALVGFDSTEPPPSYYLLPRNHVAVLIYLHHRVWLTKSAKNGTPHQDTSRRAIEAKNIAGGEGGWDRLLEPTCGIALRLSPYYSEIFDEAEALGIHPPSPVPAIECA